MNPLNIDPTIDYKGVSVPTFFYGTAWKEARTEAATRMAIEAGFRGIDTANQRRHYDEAAVGSAIQKVFASGALKREDLFLQTKFTYPASQDHRIPYDAHAEPADQVKQSLESSLSHLQTDYLDAFLLHGPSVSHGWHDTDWRVWRTMEALQHEGTVRLIGVSNVDRDQLALLLDKSEIKPAVIQNRCFASTLWDSEVRTLCRSQGIIYQGFSLLTGNAMELNSLTVRTIARRLECTLARIIFRFALQSGMIPLTGTMSEPHMLEDLSAYDINLNAEEMDAIKHIASPFRRH